MLTGGGGTGRKGAMAVPAHCYQLMHAGVVFWGSGTHTFVAELAVFLHCLVCSQGKRCYRSIDFAGKGCVTSKRTQVEQAYTTTEACDLQVSVFDSCSPGRMNSWLRE